MEIPIIAWLILSFVVAYLGTDRQIGGGWAFLWALILSPVIGFVIVAFSPSLLSLERDKVQQKQLEELRAIRISLTNSDQTQPDQCEEQQTDSEIGPDEPAIDVSKLTTWQRIKWGL